MEWTAGRVFWRPILSLNDRTLTPDNFPEMPEGVLVGSLRSIAREHPGLVEKYYGRLADLGNPVVALDTMLARDGFMLYVPKNVTLENPLQLINILGATQPLMAVRRLLIVLEDNAKAKLLVCDHTQREEVNFLSLLTVELYVGKNSELHYYDLEESSQRTSRISSLYLRQEADSRVVIDGMTLFNGVTRNEYYCDFAGENADLKLYGMAIEDRQRKVSTYSRINHAVPHCISNELFKMSADGESRCAFTGRIIVRPGSVKTEAYQACRNLLAADTARIEARPELEIYNDDVKCSHGCAIGQLDETQAFAYCMSLSDVTIPESVTHIGANCFSFCSSLREIALPAGVKELESYAFSDCSSLRRATLPANSALLGEMIFAGCGSLDSITEGSLTPPPFDCGSQPFDPDETELFQRVVLRVPAQAVEAYRKAPGWRLFDHINPIN